MAQPSSAVRSFAFLIRAYNLGEQSRALRDFADYLKISPETSHADDIRQVTLAIRRTLAALS